MRRRIRRKGYMHMRQDRVLISIIVPIYNMEQYLGRCLESIQKQTFTDFEVIMVNDGSKDKSGEICKFFLNDTRFTYIYQKNQGVSSARNIGINRASGRWVSFVDPDDSLKPEFLQSLAEYCACAGVDVISCCCEAVDDSKSWSCHFYDGNLCFCDEIDRKRNLPHGFPVWMRKTELLKQLMDTGYPNMGNKGRATAIGVPWGKLYRKDFLNRTGIRFDMDLIRMQDNIFNMYAFDQARCILYVDRALYCYSVSHIQGMRLKFDDRIDQYYGKVIKLRREYMEKKKLMKDDELYSLYLEEGAALILEINRRYFFHTEWCVPFSAKIHKIDNFFSDSIYREILENYKNLPSDRFSKLGKIGFFLLKGRHYRMYLAAEKMNRIRYLINS